jgi:hypothetical protein
MARNLSSQSNVDTPSSDYPSGRIRNKNNSANPPIVGTPIIEEIYGDIIEFFQKLLRLGSINPNGYPDNETNGHQLLTGLSLYVDAKDTVVANAAASDATSKANAAESNAISAAALDATSKANAAESNANDYTDGIASGLTANINDIGDSYYNFNLVGIANQVLLNSSTISYTKFGKTVIMTIQVNFNCQSGFSGNYVRLLESGTDYAYLRPYSLIEVGGGMYHNSNRTSCFGVLLDNSLSTKFGIDIRNYDGSDFTIGQSYNCTFAIAYRAIE